MPAHVAGHATGGTHRHIFWRKVMIERMQQLRAIALVFALVLFAGISPALAQPTPEVQPTTPPAGEATPPRTEPRDGIEGANERRRESGADERGRDRDEWRERGQRGGHEFTRETGDWPRSAMMRHAMMIDHSWLMQICSPDGDRIVTFMLDRLERLTQPTQGQRAGFDSLKDAAARASEMARAACPKEEPITPPGRLAAAEKRLEALLQAVRTVRPAMEAFYGSLTDEQKARLLLAQARLRQWGDWHERRELGGERERRRDRTFEENRSERRDPSWGRWREEDDEGPPRRGWGGSRYDEDLPRAGPRDYRDRWPERR
jgi:hypothetical protein